MQKGQRFKPLLDKAKEFEERYDWLGAVDSYEKAFGLALKLEDFLEAAEIRDQMGFCFYRAALQAETHKDFRSRMKLAVGAYERAAEFFEKVEEEGKRARINHFRAMAAYASSWLAADPEKRTKYYQMAEKVLQTSAGSYMKAKHPEKSAEVQRILEKVREERELAASLSEVLHAPPIASTTVSFSTPTPTHEKAVGLERFEHADIQANLIPRLQEVKIGEDVTLEIELVNAGKGPALLIKVDEIIPEGFKLVEKPEAYRAEDRHLDMKGKRLPPLKTEEVKLVLRPLNKGTFHLKPMVFYLDETGKYKSHEPEPATVIVKELGISGWLKGPTK